MPSNEREMVYSDDSDVLEEKDGNNFGVTIHRHVRDIVAGGIRPFLVEMVSTSIQSQIPHKIQKHIWANKFIDSAVLLPLNDSVNLRFK